jgi:hypothetical protein
MAAPKPLPDTAVRAAGTLPTGGGIRRDQEHSDLSAKAPLR